MSLAVIHAAVAVWWSFAALIFCALTFDADNDIRSRVVFAVFWPFVAIFMLPRAIWRAHFRTVRQMKMDIKNKQQWGDYQEWLRAKKGKDEQGVDQ